MLFAQNCHKNCQNLRKNWQVLPQKSTQNLHKFYSKSGPKKGVVFAILLVKIGAKLHQFPSIFCSKFIPKWQLLRRIFPLGWPLFCYKKQGYLWTFRCKNTLAIGVFFCIKSCAIFAIFCQEFSLAKRPKMLANNYFGHNAMSKIIMKKFCNIYFLNSQKLSR